MRTIHFVCRGNVYRSRLAEAYAKSLLPEKADSISSSGIEAKLALNGNVDPEAVLQLEAGGIKQYLTTSWHQTTQKDVDDNDMIIFMSQTLYEQASKLFDIDDNKVEVWNIPDVDGIYSLIKENVDSLVQTKF